MNKKYLSVLFIVIGLLLLSSCNIVGNRNEIRKLFTSEGQQADERMEQIISAIKADDKDALKKLFSEKAVDESGDLDGEIDALFDFIQGDIVSWERDGWSSDESINYGKSSLMIRPSFTVVTDEEEYSFFLIDYATDTIDPDNEGVYMMEVSKTSYSGEWESWQDRMRAGIPIVE